MVCNMRCVVFLIALLWTAPVWAQSYLGPTGGASFVSSAPGATTASTLAQRFSHFLNVMDDFGAKGNALSYAGSGMTASSPNLNQNGATFTSADVGKKIVVDYAGSAGAPLITTIQSVTNSHNVVLAANASTSTPYRFITGLIPVAYASSGGGYAVGDTVTMAGGTFTTAAIGTVRIVNVVAASIVAGGSTFVGNNGLVTGVSCVVQGTTGSGGNKFLLNVTLTSGAISSINSVVNRGQYTTNLTTPSAEPVASYSGANGCTGGTGATVNVTTWIVAIAPTTQGVYASAGGVPTTFTQGSTSGSGTGATFTATNTAAGSTTYWTDDTTAFTNAINAEIAANVAGNEICMYLPAGRYGISSTLPTFYYSTSGIGTSGCVMGIGNHKSMVYMSPALSGDLFSWSRNFNFTQGSDNNITFTPQAQGARFTGIAIYGDLTTSNTQTALDFYDENGLAVIDDVEVDYVNGSALAFGALLNSTNGYIVETYIDRFRATFCGNSSSPCVNFNANGTGQASNEIKVDRMDIFAPQGTGLQIHGVTSGAYDFQFGRLRIEGIQFDATSLPYDLLIIGDTSENGQVDNISFNSLELINGAPGQAAMRLTATSSGVEPYSITVVSGFIAGGQGFSKGLEIDFGRFSTFYWTNMNTNDVSVALGNSVGCCVNIYGPGGADTAWTWSSTSSGSSGNIASPMWRFGVPFYGLTSASYGGVYHDNSPGAGGTLGSGAVDFQALRSQVYAAATGTQAVVLAGTNNQASGSNTTVLNGSNIAGSGTYAVNSGLRTTDRAWYGGRCHSTGSLTDFSGDAQFCDQVLRCQAAATNGSTCRATADNTTAGTTDVVNIPNNAAYTVTLDCVSMDRTTVGNNETWPAWTMLLTRGSNAASTALTTNTTPTPLTNGTVTGSTIAATADTTNGGLNVTFTSPSTNSHLWDFTCHAQTHQVQ
jgi:hypothetical protein